MKFLATLTTVLMLAAATATAADKVELKSVDKLPEGVPAEFAKHLAPAGYSVVGADGVVCNVWMVKGAPVKEGFKPNLFIKYPFSSGQLVGLIQVVQESEYTDFRGQEIPAGLYTLRYGLQPQDGNHIGTSETRDFLLGTPVKDDESPAIVSDEYKLFDHSAKAAGTAHPAIYALQGSEKAEQAEVIHDENLELWILNVPVEAKAGDKVVKLPLKLVVIGQSEG